MFKRKKGKIVIPSAQPMAAEQKNNLTTDPEFVLKGIPSSPGIAYGRAVLIQPEALDISTENITPDKIPAEIKRLETARKKVVDEFFYLLKRVRKESKDVISVIETNLDILNDKYLFDSITKRINSFFSAESAVMQEFDFQRKMLKNAKDASLRERAFELDSIMERLLSALKDKNYYYKIARNSIVVTQSVTPSDLVNYKESGVIAIITEIGGISSHSSILARSFEIPEVIGIKDATSLIRHNSLLVVDGYSGEVILNPAADTVTTYNARKRREKEHKEKLGALIKEPSETKDGKSVGLYANVDFSEDIVSAIMFGADGIGLVRSEYITIGNEGFPDEERQYAIYNEIAERAYPKPVTFRVFDVGSDKFSDGLPQKEANPALGFRGIRYLLSNKEVFRTQLRAILRASRNKNVRLMLPMISSLDELILSHDLIKECKNQLLAKDILFDNSMPVGIMIETPAAALMADRLSEYSDFFSIGTNDLTQYTLAADRTNEYVSQIFDPLHPAVIRLIKLTVEAAKRKNIPVSICGELAGHAGATSLLIGLGVDELSVAPALLLELKNRVRSINYNEAVSLADEVLSYTS